MVFCVFRVAFCGFRVGCVVSEVGSLWLRSGFDVVELQELFLYGSGLGMLWLLSLVDVFSEWVM